MKTTFIAIVLLVCGSAASFGADQQAMKQALQRDAQHCADAFLKRDYETLSGCAHARDLQRYGGRERFAAMLRAGVEQMIDAQGFTVESKTYELPGEIQDAGKFYYAVIEGRSVLVGTVGKGPTQGKRGRFTSSGFELGISEDQGQSWKLVALSSETVFSIFPELKGKIQVPAFQPPVLLEWLSGDGPQ